MADNKVTIEIAVEGNAQVQFKKLSDSAEQFATDAKKSFGDAGRIFDNFVANLASNAVTGALNGIKAGFSAFNDILVDSIKAASEQEDAVNSLNTALKSSGQFSAEASAEFQQLANEIQRTSKFSDDAVLSATALIGSISKLGKEDLKDATRAAVELSAALGVDLDTAARKVAEAAEGQTIKIKGFKIEADQAKSASENFANALREISKFSGSAEAQTNTFSGAVAQLKNQYGEVLESLGNTIIQSPAVIAAINGMSKAVADLSNYFTTTGKDSEAIRTILLFLIDSMYVAVQVTRDLSIFFLQLGQTMVAVQAIALKVASELPGGFFKTAEAAEEAKKQAYDLKETIAGLQNNEAINLITASISEMRVAVQEADLATQGLKQTNQTAFDDKLAQTEQEKTQADLDAQTKLAQQEQSQASALTSLQTYLQARNEMLAKKDDEASKAQITKNNERLKNINSMLETNATHQMELQKKTTENQQKEDERKQQSNMTTLNTIASLSKSKTAELAAIGKTAAIAQATISTYAGAANALKDVPFPFNFVAAAAVITAGLVNVSNIIGTPLATGITEVPAGFQGDTFPARLSSGERVVSAPQNRDLTEFISGSTGLTAKLDQLISVISLNQGRMSVSIDGRELVTALQNQLDSGRALDV